MAWGRMDDGFDDHPKVVALLDEDDLVTAGVAIGLWTLCWSWAHRNTRKPGKTPGKIPAGLPRRFFGAAGKDAAQLLIKHRLWHACDDGDWQFHDFDDYLPTEETRQARSEAGKRGAAKRWAGHQKASESDKETSENGKLPSACHDAVSNEVASAGSRTPAHWDPTPTPTPIPENSPDLPSEDLFGATASTRDDTEAQKPAKRTARVACRIPDDFAVTAEMSAWAAEKAGLVDWPSETENFIDYWQARAKDDTKKDWPAAWRTWMRNAQKDLANKGVNRRWVPGTEEQGRAGSELARRHHMPSQARSPADQRVVDNQDLYEKYRQQEQEANA